MKVSELAAAIGAEFTGKDCEIAGISPIDNIAAGNLVPLLGKDLPENVFDSGAGCFLTKKGAELPDGVTAILADDAEVALVNAVNSLYPPKKRPAGIHPKAFVDETAKLGEGVSVGANATVGVGCVIGDNTQILPGAVIGDDVTIGSDAIIYANVSIYDGCTLGDRVIIHSGSVIGSDGFGYYQKAGTNLKIPHIGSVVIHDDVEIGSNSCVDRGKFSDTVIGTGTKIDNQVQVAHNDVIGKHCILAGQTGLAGSVVIGDYVFMGGRAGAADHINICSKVILAGNTGVISDIDKPGIYAGFPHNSRKSYMREAALTRDLPNIVKRITELEKKIND